MKTRNGFVSNSSTSSFVIVFPDRPKSTEDVHRFLFNGVDGEIGLDYYNETMSFKDVSERVFKDAIKNGKATKKALADEIESLLHIDYMDLKDDLKCDSIGRHFVSLIHSSVMSDSKIMDYIKEEIDTEKEEREKEKELMVECGVENFWKDKVSKEAKEKHNKLRKKYTTKSFEIMDNIGKIIRRLALKDAQKFIDDHKGWWYAVISYGDENRGEGLLEHGDIFRHIEHIHISHH